MDLVPGDHFLMTFHNHCLPLSLFRVLKGRKSKVLSLQQHRRPLYIHTLHVNRESCSHVVYGVYVHPSMKSCPVRGRSCPRRQPSSPALSPRHVTAPYATLPYPDRIYRTLPACLPLHRAHPPLCDPDLSLSLFLCYCRMALLHCTVQPVMAISTSAPCSWRRGLTSQLKAR